jgi:hypothetical protein
LQATPFSSSFEKHTLRHSDTVQFTKQVVNPYDASLDLAAPNTGRLRDGDVALALAIGCQLLEFFFAYPATVLKMLLVAVCTFPGRAAFLPALLVSQFYASDFLLGDIQTYEYLLDRHESARVTVLGFPLTTNYVFAFCVTIRVLHEALSRPRTFAGIISPAWLWLWASCFLPAILATFYGRAERNFSWTAPLRDTMMVGSLFFGMILARDKRETIAVIRGRLVPLAAIMVTLSMVGCFYSRGMYFVTSLGPALFLSWKTFSGRAGRWALYAYLFALTTLYAFALYPTAYARRVAELLYSTSGNSVALIACWLFPILLIGFVRRNARTDSRRRGPLALLPAAGGLFAFAFPIVFALFSFTLNVDVAKVKDIGELPIRDRVTYKLFADRAPIWRGALDEILTPPYVLKAGGRSEGYRLMVDGDKKPWPAGSHNLPLEELRRNGLYAGLICLILILRGSVYALRAVINASDPLVRAFAIASFSSLFILTLTSHIPMETNAALWLLGPAGMCAYLVQGGRTAVQRTRHFPVQHASTWPGGEVGGAYAH